MKKPLRSTAGFLAAVMVSGLIATQAVSSAGAAPVVPAYTPTVDCSPVAPPKPTPTPTPTPTSTASPTASPSPTTPPVPTPPATPDDFTPRDGTVSHNNPIGNYAEKRANSGTIIRAINSTPTCETIKLATWNYRSAETSDAIKAAVKRGVQVRLIMAASNNGPKGSDSDNPVFRDLQAFLAASNANLNPVLANAGRTNGARTCGSSCRYGDGAAHSKFYSFSRVGDATKVVFYGSHNLTVAATFVQWNDLYTVQDNAFFDFMTNSIFEESWDKTRTNNPYRRKSFPTLGMDVYAYQGAGRTSGADPIMAVLNKVKCTSAGAAGISGRTAIRINNAAMLNQRAVDLSNKLVRLKKAGCNVRVMVTNIGYNAMKALQRGGVPLRQLARYNTRSRQYTLYTHSKVLAISGNYGGASNQKVVFNGTANWTAKTLVSDELVGEIRRPAVVDKYNNFINYWYAKTPMGSKVVPTTNQVDGRSSDPWAGVEQDF